MRNLKKVLALVLALAMSMSLVTIANAADFSDKADINYEEAVDVMNAIGVLQGFEDGSFKPGEILTREQAAKIICTMLLGDNAEKLGTTTSSFKDVAATRWSAPYIEYCASLGIIAGNGDGTFNPTGKLTGYAFAKMLLTALGYDAEIEGFVGAGWNLKVAAMASRSGILSDISDFIGTSAVTREQAAQMALSTLKAIKVEYIGNSVEVSGPDINVSVGNNKFSYIVNKTSTDGNVDETSNGDGYMQFAEQHFPDLKITTTAATEDDFGRPSNSWSLKNVTIGTYAKAPAFSYTAEVSGDTTADKVKAMGLKDYTVKAGTTVVTNGQVGSVITSVNDIPAYTKNGTLVEVYTSSDTADQIVAVVVIKTQLMQIDRINSTAKTVSLKKIDAADQSVATVKDDNDCYAALTSMKEDDYVLVTYVQSGATKVVADIAVPTTTTGTLSSVSTNASGATVTGVTINGSTYKLSEINHGFASLDATSVNAKVESTVYLDAYGYACYIKDVTSGSDFVVALSQYNSLVDGKIVHIATVVDAAGNTKELNLGTTQSVSAGTVYKCEAADETVSNQGGEYKVTPATATTSATATGTIALTATKSINASDVRLNSTNASTANSAVQTALYADDVTFLYLETDAGTLKVSSVKTGVQKVSSIPSGSVAIYDKVGNSYKVTAVIIMSADADATGSDVIYVQKQTGTTKVGNKNAYIYTVIMNGEEVTGVVSTTANLAGDFATYSVEDEANNVYKLVEFKHADRNPAVVNDATVASTADGRLITLNQVSNATVGGTANQNFTLTDANATNAVIMDVSGDGYGVSSISDIQDLISNGRVVYVDVIFNGNSDATGYNTVSYIFVYDVVTTSYSITTPSITAASAKGITIDSITANVTGTVAHGTSVTYTVKYYGTASDDATITFTAGSNCTAPSTTTISIPNTTDCGADADHATTATFVISNVTGAIASSVTVA